MSSANAPDAAADWQARQAPVRPRRGQPAPDRTARKGLPARLAGVRVRGLRAAVLPAVRGARPGRAGRQGAGSRRGAHPVPGFRRARPARGVLDERRHVRLDVQHLLPAEVRQAVRRDPGHADAPGPGGAGGDRLGAAPRRHLRRGVHPGHAGAGPGALAMGGAGRADRGADRLRLRRPGHDRDDVHEELAGLRLRDPGQHAALPVLRDVLPARHLPAGDPGDHRVHAAVPGRRAAARPDPRGGRSRSPVARGLPGRARPGRPVRRRPPPRQSCSWSDRSPGGIGSGEAGGAAADRRTDG